MRSPSRKLARGMITFTLVAAALAPMPAPADHGAACGGWWTEQRMCFLYIRGVPVTVMTDVTGEDEAAPVEARVWIEIADTTVLLECTASGSGEATCDNQIGPDQRVSLPALIGVVATCHVEGTGGGWYWCQSGFGF